MRARNAPIGRVATLFLLGGLGAATLGPGCAGQPAGEGDEDVGIAEGATSHTTLAPVGDPRLDPTCTKVAGSDTTVHGIDYPFHEPGPCPATDEFTFDQAAAACGSDVKYFGFTCTEFGSGATATHTWTVYYGCCGVSTIGCADGSREGFTDVARYPRIASCAAAWSVPGVLAPDTFTPTCGRNSGNTSTNTSGTGCTVADACANGWHVCNSEADVAASLGSATTCADAGTGFFATRQSGPGCGVCATGSTPGCNGSSCQIGCAQNQQTANDVFGCGSVGADQLSTTCGVLDKFSQNLCGALPSDWSCAAAAPAGITEAQVVVKTDTQNGGVLCCHD